MCCAKKDKRDKCGSIRLQKKIPFFSSKLSYLNYFFQLSHCNESHVSLGNVFAILSRQPDFLNLLRCSQIHLEMLLGAHGVSGKVSLNPPSSVRILARISVMFIPSSDSWASVEHFEVSVVVINNRSSLILCRGWVGGFLRGPVIALCLVNSSGVTPRPLGTTNAGRVVGGVLLGAVKLPKTWIHSIFVFLLFRFLLFVVDAQLPNVFARARFPRKKWRVRRSNEIV